MKINNFIYILLAAYLATFLRIIINSNFVISMIGSFLVGFFISKRLSYSIEKILLSGFFSCFTSFSGFILVLYQLLSQGNFLLVILYSNLAIILSLILMHLGFLIGRKFT